MTNRCIDLNELHAEKQELEKYIGEKLTEMVNKYCLIAVDINLEFTIERNIVKEQVISEVYCNIRTEV